MRRSRSNARLLGADPLRTSQQNVEQVVRLWLQAPPRVREAIWEVLKLMRRLKE